MRILVTGHTGFVGKSLVNFLSTTENNLIFVDFDLNKQDKVLNFIKTNKPDVVIHLAADCWNKPVIYDINRQLQNNISTTHNLLFALDYYKIKSRFLYLSTASISSEITTIYGISKAASENLVDLYTKNGYIDGLNVRTTALVGVKAKHGLLYDIVSKLTDMSVDTLDLIGVSPGSIKPFSHVDELAEMLYNLCCYPYDTLTSTIEVGNSDKLSVKMIAEMAMSEFRIYKNIKWSGSYPTGDQQVLNLHPFIKTPSNSVQSIQKVLQEYVSVLCDGKWKIPH